MPVASIRSAVGARTVRSDQIGLCCRLDGVATHLWPGSVAYFELGGWCVLPGRYGEAMPEILMHDGDGSWRSPDAFDYDDEAALQELLAGHPTLIPGVSPDAKTVRELQSGVGPADVVAVDRDGELIVVECKLAANQQVRREIVGQVFDYAAQLQKMSLDEFEARWQKRAGSPLFGPTDSAARTALAANLSEGRFRLVLAVDRVNPTLRDIVEFLSASLRPETSLLVVEYRRWRDGTQEFLVPQIYGENLEPLDSLPAPAKPLQRWTLEDYLDWVEGNDPAALPTVTAIVNAQQELGSTYEGGRGKNPSGFFRMFASSGLTAKPFSFFSYLGAGTRLEINFEPTWTDLWREDADAWQRIQIMLDELEKLPELSVAVHSVRASNLWNRPGVLIRTLSPNSTSQIVQCLAALVQA